MQRLIKKEKSQLLKEELDYQLSIKKEEKDKQKARDNYFYEEIMKKEKALKDKEEMERKERLKRYRNYSSDNKNLVDITKSSRLKDSEYFE